MHLGPLEVLYSFHSNQACDRTVLSLSQLSTWLVELFITEASTKAGMVFRLLLQNLIDVQNRTGSLDLLRS